jgi:adenine C2-methylase RlmN of 23S rRNA A2503 and tRNA A37
MSALVNGQNSQPEILSIIQSTNNYETRNWDTELAFRYVLAFGHAIVEASLFRHYSQGRHIKDVLELPTSYGCPVGCIHCASGELIATRPLTTGQITVMADLMAAKTGLSYEHPFLVTFSGIAEGALRRKVIEGAVSLLYSRFVNVRFTLTTVGFDSSYIAFVDYLAASYPVHWLQVSWLHHDPEVLSRLVPTSFGRRFDIESLLTAISACEKVRVRLNYVVMTGINDSRNDIDAFLDCIRRHSFAGTVRVSRYNTTTPGDRAGLRPPTMGTLSMIVDRIRDVGHDAYAFASHRDDRLNCGQLAYDYRAPGK